MYKIFCQTCSSMDYNNLNFYFNYTDFLKNKRNEETKYYYKRIY